MSENEEMRRTFILVLPEMAATLKWRRPRRIALTNGASSASSDQSSAGYDHIVAFPQRGSLRTVSARQKPGVIKQMHGGNWEENLKEKCLLSFSYSDRHGIYE
jgi:hypothetical protein